MIDDGADAPDGAGDARSSLHEVIPPALAGERIDRIVSLITGVSRAEAAKLVAAGGASLDGTVQRSGKVRVATGQSLAIDRSCLPVVALPEPDGTVVVTVVYADDHVVVIDKPAGLVVHPGAGNPGGTLVNGLLARFPRIAAVGEPHRPGIVHRLDAGTSGLLVAALSPEAYAGLTTALAGHDVERTYRTLVWGHPEHAVGMVDGPIGRDQRDPLRMAVVVDGKPARTHYRVEATHARPADVAELECRLETGRTHQIRVHLAAIGHPVVGDATYGGARSPLVVGRPFLHAAVLAFDHPVGGAPMRFESPLPADLEDVLATLG
jgi:23S rRNA pseudouridine1911/1915/1917 synthase